MKQTCRYNTPTNVMPIGHVIIQFRLKHSLFEILSFNVFLQLVYIDRKFGTLFSFNNICPYLHTIRLSYNTKKQAFSAMPIRMRTSISNSNIVVFFTKDNKKYLPKKGALKPMFRVVLQTKRGNCINTVKIDRFLPKRYLL